MASSGDEQLRGLLVRERAVVADRVTTLSRDLETILDASLLVSTDDEHDPEGSTIAFERSQTSAFLADARRRLADLDSALDRIEAGDYGRCETCGDPIAVERLLVRPAARTCIRCAV